MRHNFLLVRYKAIKDDLYYNSLENCHLLLSFHKSLLLNSATWIEIFGKNKIEHDSLSRCERLETFIEKIFDENIQNPSKRD